MGCCKPDYQTGSHDAQVVNCITNDVYHHAHHAQITVVVAAMSMAVTAQVFTVMLFEINMFVVMMLSHVSSTPLTDLVELIGLTFVLES